MGYEFLKHFIKEPIYLINESDEKKNEDSVVNEDQGALDGSDITDMEPEDTIEKSLTQDISHNEPAKSIPLDEVGTNILVIVRYPYVNTLPENEKTLLVKILKALGIEFKDTTLLNLEFGNIPEKENLDNYSHILIFDNKESVLTALGLKKEKYTQQEIGAINCVVSDPLESIYEDTNKKTRLWNVLRKIFDIN